MTPKRIEWRIRRQFSSGMFYATELTAMGRDGVDVDDSSTGKTPCDFGTKARARAAAVLAGKPWHVVRVNVYRVQVTTRRKRVDATEHKGTVEEGVSG